jgi:hypothetical protein
VVAPVVTQAAAPEEETLTPEKARICAALEGVLARDFGLDPANSREGLGWYRFSIDGVWFQGGVQDDFRVLATLCRNETDVDIDKLMASIRKANTGRTEARFAEADGYIHVRAACPLEDASEARVQAIIAACWAAIESKEGQSLRVKYRSFD